MFIEHGNDVDENTSWDVFALRLVGVPEKVFIMVTRANNDIKSYIWDWDGIRRTSEGSSAKNTALRR